MSLKTKIIAYTDATTLFWFLVAAIVMVAGLYMYSVKQTVVLVAERNKIEAKISANQAVITQLESKDISEKNQISKQLAVALGYSEAAHVVYIPTKTVGVLTSSHTIE